jgi:PhnB protein
MTVLRTQISPMLAVSDGNAAIEFYRTAFGAELLWRLGDEQVAAGLSIDGAKFFLARESPSDGARSPASAGFTTVRVELFVDDPAAVHRQAVAAGARDRSAVEERQHPMQGPHPMQRMLQGSVVDPSGHRWLVGKILEQPAGRSPYAAMTFFWNRRAAAKKSKAPMIVSINPSNHRCRRPAPRRMMPRVMLMKYVAGTNMLMM